MKYFVLVFFVNVLFVHIAIAQHIPINSEILWEISIDGHDKKSYLLGTFHETTNEIGYEFLDSLDVFNVILERVSAVCTECNSNDKSFQQEQILFLKKYLTQNYPSYALLPDSVKCFSDIFDHKMELLYIDKFIQELKIQEIVPSFHYQKLKPAFIMTLIQLYKSIIDVSRNLDKRHVNFVAMDKGINNKALKMGKRLFFMETPQEQFVLLNNMDSTFVEEYSLKDQAHILYNYCKAQKEGRTVDSYMSKIRNYYIIGDLTSMQRERNKMIQDMGQLIPNQSNIATADELMSGRNCKWIPKIVSNIEKESCLIAVGIFHLTGEMGLINLLRKEGYNMKVIDIKAANLLNP